MANLNKVRFRVVDFTSEDPDYPASQLNEVSPTTKGWQSVRFCTFPQEIGFEILDGETRITQIQILSHQSKIASKVEIYMGKGVSYDTAQFKRLGYLSLDSNERSNYQARELKTVFVDYSGSFLKLLVFENHVNKVNMYNQVGIVALSLLGAEDDSKPYSRMEKPSAKSVYQNPYNDLTVDINLDPATANKLRQLAEAKAKAIAREDYSTAKQIKTVEQDLKTLGSRLAQLDMAKTEAVAAEDYDLAKEIKDECDVLRGEIETKIRNISIPGVNLSAGRKHEAEIDIKPSSNRSPRNVDDLPVGGQAGKPPARMESFHAGGKKAVKVELVEHPGFEDHDADTGSSSNLPPGDEDDRPIRPKANTFYDDKEAEDGGVSSAATNMPAETFPAGQHPLEGISGWPELPTPELLTIKSREYVESTGIGRVLGEYRARCLFSKSWNLREAAVQKAHNMLQSGELDGDFAALLPALGGVLKIGAEDKIQQVLFSALSLMETVLKEGKGARISKSQAVPIFDPVIVQFVDKLADGNARLREGARKGLDLLSASPLVGAHAVASQLMKPLPAKQKTGWRPLATRLQILTDLAGGYGVVGGGGQGGALPLDMLLRFPKDTQAFAHSNKEVRDAAKDLIVALQLQVGTAPLEGTLELLRKNQKEEYLAAFDASSAQDKGGGSKPSAKPSADRGEKAHHPPSHAAGGKVPTSSNKVQQHKEGYDLPSHPSHSPRKKGQEESAGAGEGGAGDFTSCMFCGEQNKAWNENDLDLHYWKDCPLLISCPSCTQIIEIAGLPEHLLDECEEKKNYVPCEVTGLAIRANEFDDWSKSSRCKPAPPNFMYCPLCLSTVEDSDEAWTTHLFKKCAKNTRIHPS